MSAGSQVRRPIRLARLARMRPDDPRLGERLSDYATAQVAILGCPQDEGVQRNGGRPGAAQGPAEIRRALYKLTVNGLESLRIHDAGDTAPLATLEETHAAHEAAVVKLLADGKRVIVLGGGNDISYPDCAALAKDAGDVLAFNVDAHFDVRPDASRNSGTPYRQLLEEGLLKGARFFELGSQAFCTAAEHAQYLKEKRATVVPLRRCAPRVPRAWCAARCARRKAPGRCSGASISTWSTPATRPVFPRPILWACPAPSCASSRRWPARSRARASSSSAR